MCGSTRIGTKAHNEGWWNNDARDVIKRKHKVYLLTLHNTYGEPK